MTTVPTVTELEPDLELAFYQYLGLCEPTHAVFSGKSRGGV